MYTTYCNSNDAFSQRIQNASIDHWQMHH